MAKYRNLYWELILYKEWDFSVTYLFSTFSRYGVRAVLSPLHDKDVFEKDSRNDTYKAGDKKKPHYHCLLLFDSLKSADQVLDLVQEVISNFSSSCLQKVISIKGAFEYLTHKNNPEKAQYNENLIFTTANTSVQELKDELKDKKSYTDIFQIIKKYKIKSLLKLTDFLLENKDNHNLDIVMQRAYFFNLYFNAMLG